MWHHRCFKLVVSSSLGNKSLALLHNKYKSWNDQELNHRVSSIYHRDSIQQSCHDALDFCLGSEQCIERGLCNFHDKISDFSPSKVKGLLVLEHSSEPSELASSKPKVGDNHNVL